MIELKTAKEIERMAVAGQILAQCFDRVRQAVRPGVTTCELDQVVAQTLGELGATATFLDYHGFPASCCASPNAIIAHGIPDHHPLNDGDIISLDIGATVAGWVTDGAATYPVGTVDPLSRALIAAGEAALQAGIAAAQVGARVGAIGAAIEAVAEQAGFAVFTEYTGHGVGRQLHEDPNVPNVGPVDRGPVLQAGMTLAIEPMFVTGDPAIVVLDNGWSAQTRDHSRATHCEHTIAITNAGPRILTA
jgi:methionyl aminopeptidase